MEIYTKEHVEKLVELAFLKGQAVATEKFLIKINKSLENLHGNGQPEDFAYYTVAEREATNTFLTTFSGCG